MGLKKGVETAPYDFADYIKTEDDVRTVLSMAFEDNDPAIITSKIGAIARSQGMSAIAAATGLQREGLYKSLSDTGNPELKTLLKILDALGLVLAIRPKAKATKSDTAAARKPERAATTTRRSSPVRAGGDRPKRMAKAAKPAVAKKADSAPAG